MNGNDQDDVNDDDRIVTLSTLEEVGASGRGPYVQIDKKYNIDETTTLDLNISHFFLVSGLCNLTNLMKIKFIGLVSFPAEELSRLPNLIDLECYNCSSYDAPNSNQQLSSLKSFAMSGRGLHDSNFNKWIVRSLPVLEELHYSGYDGEMSMYTALQSDDCVFNQSLRILEISTDFVNVAETMIIDIIPKFPNVQHIDTRGDHFYKLENNNFFCGDEFMGAGSLKNIAQRLKQIDTSNIQLRTVLGLLSGPFLRFRVTTDPIEKQTLDRDMMEGGLVSTMGQLPEETQAMLSILSSFRCVYNIGNYRLNAEVELMLRINHGAGALVDGPSHRNEPIPLSYWPIILERVYEQSKSTFAKNISSKDGKKRKFILGERNVAGMHNLVRNGPLFQHILQLGKLYVPPPPPPRRSISRKRKNPK